MGRGDPTSEQWVVLEPLLPKGAKGAKAGRPSAWSRRQLSCPSDVWAVSGNRGQSGAGCRDDSDHDGWVWPGSGGDPTPENVQRAWPATVAALPIGTAVTGRVIGRQPFGVFVLIEGAPDAVGLAEVLGTPVGAVPPPVGRVISGRVVGHADHNCQVRITLDSGAAPKHDGTLDA